MTEVIVGKEIVEENLEEKAREMRISFKCRD
jgi:hypothetical protein